MDELINGIEILTVHNYYRPTLLNIIIALVILSICILIGCKITNMISTIIGLIIVLILTIIGLSGTSKYLSKQYETEYECYVHEEEVSFKEFYKSYEILNKDGKIYTIKRKEEK